LIDDKQPIEAALDRNIGSPTAPGERAEHDIDAFIGSRHNRRVKNEGERAIEELWRASEKRQEARRAEEERVGLVAFYRHLQNVYTNRAAECGRTADTYEGKSA